MAWVKSVVWPQVLKAVDTPTETAPKSYFTVKPAVPRKRAKAKQAPKPKPRYITHFSPKPERLHKGPRIQESGLTVRGLRLGSRLGDVERLLGLPDIYHGFELTIWFLEKRVTNFNLRESDFQDSCGC